MTRDTRQRWLDALERDEVFIRIRPSHLEPACGVVMNREETGMREIKGFKDHHRVHPVW